MFYIYKTEEIKMIERHIIIPDFMILLKKISEKPACASDIQVSTNMTYAYIHNMKKHFSKRKWIIINKDGVAHNMNITEKSIGKGSSIQ
jgi:predicted transcriptional regulator